MAVPFFFARGEDANEKRTARQEGNGMNDKIRLEIRTGTRVYLSSRWAETSGSGSGSGWNTLTRYTHIE